MVGHTEIETRSRHLRVAAVENHSQRGNPAVRRRVGDEGLRIVNFICEQPFKFNRFKPDSSKRGGRLTSASSRGNTEVPALFGFTGVKVRGYWPGKFDVKAPSSTRELHWILLGLRIEETGILGVAVKCVYREEHQWRRRVSGRF